MPTPKDKQLFENRIKELLPLFPDYIQEYHLSQKRKKRSVTTRLGYLHEYKLFFNWLLEENALSAPYSSMKEIPYSELEKLSKTTVEFFIDYLRDEPIKETDDGEVEYRSDASIARTISALKSLFNYLTTETEDDNGECYFYRNVMTKIKIFSDKETASSRANQISQNILHREAIGNFIEYLKHDYENELTSKRKLIAFQKNKERDVAIISLFLGTGLRVSELASLKISSINFKEQLITTVRKGNKTDTIEVLPAALDDVQDYLAVRSAKYKIDEDFPFLFVSTYGQKANPLSVRSIQNLVETYTKAFTKGTKMSPHKLRHSYATDFINNGGNIILLRDQLGHDTMETTSKYTNLDRKERRKITQKMNDSRLGVSVEED